MNVILIDDHPLVRQGLKSVLSLENDIKIIGEASNKEEGINLIKDFKPDLVMLDIRLGHENGLDVIEYCNKIKINVKFLVLTSSVDEWDFKNAKNLGAQGYILKEALPEELIYAIQLVSRDRRYYDPGIMDEIMDDSHDLLKELTDREQEVLISLGEGLSNKDIANKLFISIYTVKKHVSQILAKLELADRTQAALYAQSRLLQKIS